MSPGQRPPIVPHGPWRNPGALPPLPREEPTESSWAWEVVKGLIDIIDVDFFELVFGFFRVVAHIIVVALHAIFHW